MDNVIESSTSNASVVHDIQTSNTEVKPMTININKNNIKKFNWKVYKFTIKQLNINAEYKALRHFNKYAKPGTKNYMKYLRNLYGIMPYFDEKTYITHANINENISLEQLYIYFKNNGYKEYPLNDNYDKLYYNVEPVFNAVAYYKRYNEQIENYLYTDDNYDANSDDWETGSQMSSITSFSQVSTVTTQTRGSMLSAFIDNANNHRHGRVISQDERIAQTNNDEYNRWKENLYNWYDVPDSLNKKIYKFYKERKADCPLDNNYFLIKHNINNPLFDTSVYCKINNLNYNLNNIEDIDNIYKLFSNNQVLNDNYYKIYYNIPSDLHVETFIQRYFSIFENKHNFLKNIGQEQKNYVYMVFDKLKGSSNFSYLDDIYFRILYNIPNSFNFKSYVIRYSEINDKLNNKKLKDVNNYVKITKEEKHIYENFEVYSTQYNLDDNYYRILYNIPKEFDYTIFIKVYPEVIKINDLQNESIINKLSDYVKESVILDNKIKLYKYYNENSSKYEFNDIYYQKYFNTEHNISDSLNIETYIDMYEHLKIKMKSIHFDKNENKKEYYELYYKYLSDELKENKIDDSYYRNFYNIDTELDIDSYVKRYSNELSEELSSLIENTLEYNEKVYQLVNLSVMPLDDNYYKILNNLPLDFDVNIYLTKYPQLKIKLFNIPENTLEYNKELYTLANLDILPLDENYYRLLYNIPEDFDVYSYLQIYPDVRDKIKMEEINSNEEFANNIYKIVNLKLMPLTDEYYRLKYKIPDLLDPISYVKRYPDINDELIGLEVNTMEYNKKVYSLCETLLNYFKLDEKYYKIKYEIHPLFHLQALVLYKVKNNLENNNNYINEYQWFYEEGKNIIDLFSDEYLNILFNVPSDFNWKIYYFNNKDTIDSKNINEIIKTTADENNINKVKTYCYFVTKDTDIINFINNHQISKNIDNTELLESIDIEKKKYYNIDLNFNYLKYSDENAYFYMNTRIKVTVDFVYLFYTNKITLKDLYELYKNNVQNENIKETGSFTTKEMQVEQQFIKNYEYLLSTKIDSIKYREYFVLNDFIEDFYRNNDKNYHIKLNDKNEVDVINELIYNKNTEYRKLFNNYKKINYNNLLNKFKSGKLKFSSKLSDVNIGYVYFAYDKSLFTIANFLYSIKNIPENAKLYIFTNNNGFDEICNYMNNVRKINIDTIPSMSVDLINQYITENNYIFAWNTNYIMMNDHDFMKNEIINDIMISNSNWKYVNVGILRKKIGNMFKNIDTQVDLATFRKHKKMHTIVSI